MVDGESRKTSVLEACSNDVHVCCDLNGMECDAQGKDASTVSNMSVRLLRYSG